MKKVLFLIIAVGALYYFKPGIFPSFGGKEGAFDSKGNPQVLVFTRLNCGAACENVVQSLKDRNVDFQEVVVDQNDANMARFQKLGGTAIPYIMAGSHGVVGAGKTEVASALAQTFGDRYLTPFERLYFANHFKPDGSPQIYIYGASWCGYCKKLHQDLEQRHVDFVEIDVEKSPDQALMVDTMGIGGFPVTYVGYERVLHGSQVDDVLAALKTAGKRKG